MAYAYFDQYGVFHVVNDDNTARQYARDGKYIEADVPHEYGYPTVVGDDGKVKQLVIYDRGNGKFEGYIDGNQKDGKLVSSEVYARFQDALEQLTT